MTKSTKEIKLNYLFGVKCKGCHPKGEGELYSSYKEVTKVIAKVLTSNPLSAWYLRKFRMKSHSTVDNWFDGTMTIGASIRHPIKEGLIDRLRTIHNIRTAHNKYL